MGFQPTYTKEQRKVHQEFYEKHIHLRTAQIDKIIKQRKRKYRLIMAIGLALALASFLFAKTAHSDENIVKNEKPHEAPKTVQVEGLPQVPNKPVKHVLWANKGIVAQGEYGGLVSETAKKAGLDENQIEALLALMYRESGLRTIAQNPTSSAYGLCQFLDSTWQGTGYEKTSDPVLQTEACLVYIKNRYGDAVTANNFQLRHNWF